MSLISTGKVLAVAALSTMSISAFASVVVYDNTQNRNGQYFATEGSTATRTGEFGDEVILAGSSVHNRQLQSFSFDYFLSNGSGNALVTLYANDGAQVANNAYAPNTILSSTLVSGLQSGLANHVQLDFTANVILPEHVTWTVQFTGLTSGAQAGLLLSDPVSVGLSANDFWANDGGWTLSNFGGTPANFSALIVAVPEVGTLQFALMGGMAWLGFFGYRRFSK